MDNPFIYQQNIQLKLFCIKQSPIIADCQYEFKKMLISITTKTFTHPSVDIVKNVLKLKQYKLTWHDMECGIYRTPLSNKYHDDVYLNHIINYYKLLFYYKILGYKVMLAINIDSSQLKVNDDGSFTLFL